MRIKGEMKTRRIWLNDIELHPEESQKIYNHSPDGFNWGYGGSGPAQLALAILLECYNARTAQKHYQDFKRDIICGLPQTDFEKAIDIDKWLNEQCEKELGSKGKYYYQIGKLYEVDEMLLKLKAFTECEANDGQEICAGCPGKLMFGSGPTKLIKCGWGYSKYTHDYFPVYKRFNLEGQDEKDK